MINFKVLFYVMFLRIYFSVNVYMFLFYLYNSLFSIVLGFSILKKNFIFYKSILLKFRF